MNPGNTLNVAKIPLDGSVCVEASAGTGKTYAIALIVLRLILERGLEMSSMCVMTFTKAATAELSDRIADFLRLTQQYVLDPQKVPEMKYAAVYQLVNDIRLTINDDEVIRQRIASALLNIDLMQVTTIHGFCIQTLEEYAFETGSSYGTEVTANLDEHIERILEDFWRKEITTIEPALFRYFDKKIFETCGVTQIKKKIKQLLSFPESRIQQPVDVIEQISSIIEKIRDRWDEHTIAIEEFKRVAPIELLADYAPAKLGKAILELDNLRTGAEEVNFTALKLLSIDKIESARRAKSKHRFTGEIFQLMNDLIRIEKNNHNYFIKENIKQLIYYRAWKYSVRELEVFKSEQHLRSYDDMIADLARGLNRGGERSAAAIRAKYSAVLVDEFQDTDAYQYQIISSLFLHKPGVFFAVIGDPKQAIYRFRGGDINTYLKAKNAIPEEQQFTINTNYRSEKTLVDALNKIYALNEQICDSKGPFLSGGIKYEEVKSAQDLDRPAIGSDMISPVTLWNMPEGEKPENRTIGKRIAKTILTFIHCKHPLMLGAPAKRKPAALNDFAILVNSHQNAKYYKKCLAQYGIRSVIAKTGSILKSEEYEQILLVLRAILEPSNERIVRAMLVSRIYNYDPVKLATWEADSEERRDILAAMTDAKKRWERNGVAAALNSFLLRTGAFTLSTDPRNELYQERAFTNYRHLIEILNEEEVQIGKYPDRLLNAFIQMHMDANAAGDDESQQRLESDRDAVTIMTMHKAKGLQWPVVFAPDLTTDGVSNFSMSDQIYYKGDERIANFDPDRETEAKAAMKEEIRQERMRVAYVAMTRAESLLYVVTAKDWKKDQKEEGDFSPVALLLRSEGINVLSSGSDPLVRSEILADDDITGVYHKAEVPEELRTVSQWPDGKSIVQRWSIQSYSGLTKGTSHALIPSEKDDVIATGIFAFPKGPDAGTSLHTIFEKIDFIDAGNMDNHVPEPMKVLVEGILTDSGMTPRKEPELVQSALQMVRNVMQTPVPGLPADFRFGKLRKEDRIHELEFYLAAGHPDISREPITEKDLTTILGEDSGRIAKGKSIRGFLNGFIDVVFRHGDKWYIVDWKSNHLGNTTERYNTTALQSAMKQHNYYLQYHFYTVALHKYLKAVSNNTLTYDANFGGVIYVFLRGVDSAGNGFYVHRPERAVIEKLEVLL